MLKSLLWRRFNRLRVRTFQPAAIAAVALLGGCSIVGPTSIDLDRISYNEVLQTTAVEQTLLNILRVKNNEMPVFMDVTEVDATRTLTGSVNGGASSIGATPNFKSASAGTISGLVGAVTGSAQYQETPTVRYQPVIGQALVAQVATPLTATSLANFLNTHWGIAATLTLSTNRLTPGYEDYGAALNAIIALDQYGAITGVPTETTGKTDTATGGKSGRVVNNFAPQVNLSGGGAPDSITIYLQPAKIDPCGDDRARSEKIVSALWDRLLNIYGLPKGAKAITLTMKGRTAKDGKSAEPPILFPRSAIDIMRGDSIVGNHIYIKEEEEIRELIKRWEDVKSRDNRHPTCSVDFYMKRGPKKDLDEDQKAFLKEIEGRYDHTTFLATTAPEKVNLSSSERRKEGVLAASRIFMLIAKSNTRPADAYVSVLYKGQWHSVLEGDDISKQTLALIHQFNTVQAAPAQNAPLTPSISVGGR